MRKMFMCVLLIAAFLDGYLLAIDVIPSGISNVVCISIGILGFALFKEE